MPPFVNIRVTGPKTLVPELTTRGQDCDVNWTWIQFLTAKCQLRLTLVDQVIVRKASHGRGKAWEANLGDYVADFINKYSRLRTSYTIRLTMLTPRTRLSSGFQFQPEMVAAERVSHSPTVPSSIVNTVKNQGRRKGVKKVTFGGCAELCLGCPRAPSRINARTASRFQPQMELEPIRNSGFGVDDDVRSVTTYVEERELERAGLDNQLIKNGVIRRLNFVDNIELLRIHHELQTLVDDQAWYRLTYRVPRAAHLLSNIFELETSPRF